MNFGETSPPSPYDGQYQLRVLDLDQPITHPIHDLGPFKSIVSIDHNLNDSLEYIRKSSNKQFILVIITRNLTPPEIVQMFQNNPRISSNLYRLHLFFTNGSRYQKAWQNRYAPLVHSCRSITANLSRDLRTICAMFCDLNIQFCETKVEEYEENNEKSIANDFHTQKLKYVELTVEYKLQQLRESIQIESL